MHWRTVLGPAAPRMTEAAFASTSLVFCQPHNARWLTVLHNWSITDVLGSRT